MNDLEPATTVEEVLRSNGISAESVSFDGAVPLTYSMAFPGVEPDHGEVGRAVASSFGYARDDELEPRTVEATVLRNEGDVQATWTLEADWICTCDDCALDDEELSQCVLDGLYEEGDA